VIAYDSRRHGESGGDVCTYGYYEKEDLRRVIDALERGPVVLMGTSLGAGGANDRETSPAHSQRVHDALKGRKRLILVDGAGHNASLSHVAVWQQIDAWIDQGLRSAVNRSR
jgi:pimeloyl-ACP methyl ester carboxylesterase